MFIKRAVYKINKRLLKKWTNCYSIYSENRTGHQQQSSSNENYLQSHTVRDVMSFQVLSLWMTYMTIEMGDSEKYF